MLGVFWNPQDLLLLMDTEIFRIDASGGAEKLTKTRVSKIIAPSVLSYSQYLEVGDGFVEKCHNFRRRDLVGTFNLEKVLVSRHLL